MSKDNFGVKEYLFEIEYCLSFIEEETQWRRIFGDTLAYKKRGKICRLKYLAVFGRAAP